MLNVRGLNPFYGEMHGLRNVEPEVCGGRCAVLGMNAGQPGSGAEQPAHVFEVYLGE